MPFDPSVLVDPTLYPLYIAVLAVRSVLKALR
jgi:hypothetical protein